MAAKRPDTTAPPRERELKLALAPGEAARVASTPPLAGVASRRERFMAFYYDTPQRDLARHGWGLRLRREGRHWRVTLKASGRVRAGLHERPEWEFPVPGPVLDLSRFAATPLAGLPGAETLHRRLVPVLVTDFRRTRWLLEPAPGSRLEVALDEGLLAAGRRRRPVEELEIEVLDGPVAAAFDLAETLAATLVLRPEPVSKLARGLSLGRAERPRPAKAQPVSVKDIRDPREAALRLAAACLAQAQANEPGVIASADPEFIHQLRVALRRLRSALRLFRDSLGPGETVPFAEDLRWAANALGPCRDWDVFVTETLPPLVAANGDPAIARILLGRARARQREARRGARAAVQSTRWGLTMVRLARWLSQAGTSPPGTPALPDFASERLRKGARRIAELAGRIHQIDAPSRHRLRILVKRQRYAAEFLASVFKGSVVAGHVEALSAAQDILGGANDCANALAHVVGLAPPPEFVAFARGWFAAREAFSIEASGRALRRAIREPRFWRRKPKGPKTPKAAATGLPAPSPAD